MFCRIQVELALAGKELQASGSQIETSVMGSFSAPVTVCVLIVGVLILVCDVWNIHKTTRAREQSISRTRAVPFQ
jgi:hypothetical protein